MWKSDREQNSHHKSHKLSVDHAFIAMHADRVCKNTIQSLYHVTFGNRNRFKTVAEEEHQ